MDGVGFGTIGAIAKVISGSLALILVWIYYSSMILLFGAELIQAWAEQRGSGVAPEKGAVRVNELKKEAQAGQRAPA